MLANRPILARRLAWTVPIEPDSSTTKTMSLRIGAACTGAIAAAVESIKPERNRLSFIIVTSSRLSVVGGHPYRTALSADSRVVHLCRHQLTLHSMCHKA